MTVLHVCGTQSRINVSSNRKNIHVEPTARIGFVFVFICSSMLTGDPVVILLSVTD